MSRPARSIMAANKGVERNKKPLKNKVLEFKISQLNPTTDLEKFKQYKFKDLGYITLTSWYQTPSPIKGWNGFITPEQVKDLLGEKQWAKFCNGKRLFVIQRRVDGKNISKK